MPHLCVVSNKLRCDLRCRLTPPALAQRTNSSYPEPVLLSAREVLQCLVRHRNGFRVTPTFRTRRIGTDLNDVAPRVLHFPPAKIDFTLVITGGRTQRFGRWQC